MPQSNIIAGWKMPYMLWIQGRKFSCGKECCQGHGPWAAITGEGLGGTGDINSDVGTGQEVWPGGRKPVRLRRRVCAEEAGKEFEKQMVKDCQEGFWSRGVTWWKSCFKQLNFSKKGKTKTQRGVKKDITKLSDRDNQCVCFSWSK